MNSNVPALHGKADMFQELLADALAIQDRFVAEPKLKTTGTGHLKSRGVDGMTQDAAELNPNAPSCALSTIKRKTSNQYFYHHTIQMPKAGGIQPGNHKPQ